MFSKIVVGTDGSAGAGEAVRAVGDLMKANPGTEVYVVTAYRPLSPTELRGIAADLPEEFRTALSAHGGAEAALASAQAILDRAGGKVEYHEVNTDPTDAILDAAEKFEADLVVVGSRGEGVAKRAIHGSVSTKVLHHSPCSVLVVMNNG